MANVVSLNYNQVARDTSLVSSPQFPPAASGPAPGNGTIYGRRLRPQQSLSALSWPATGQPADATATPALQRQAPRRDAWSARQPPRRHRRSGLAESLPERAAKPVSRRVHRPGYLTRRPTRRPAARQPTQAPLSYPI